MHMCKCGNVSFDDNLEYVRSPRSYGEYSSEARMLLGHLLPRILQLVDLNELSVRNMQLEEDKLAVKVPCCV